MEFAYLDTNQYTKEKSQVMERINELLLYDLSIRQMKFVWSLFNSFLFRPFSFVDTYLKPQ